MHVVVIVLKYALLVSQQSYGYFYKLVDSISFENLRHFTQRIISYYTHEMAIVS